MGNVLEYINLGAVPNDGTGDGAREGGQKINNFIRRGRGDIKIIDTNITLTGIDANDFIVCENESPITITILEEGNEGSDYYYLKNSLCTIVRLGGLVTIAAGENVTLLGYNVIQTTNNWVKLRYLGENVWSIDNNSLNTGGSEGGLEITSEITGNTTLSAGHAGKYIPGNSSSDFNVTINPNVFSANNSIAIEQTAAGIITLVAGSGMTLNGALKTWGQYSVISIFFKSATVATVTGGSE